MKLHLMNYFRMIAKGETIFIRLAFVFLCVLIGVQFFFLKDSTRSYLSYIDRLEGESVSIQLPLYSVKPLYISETSKTAVNPLKSLRESKMVIVRIINPRTVENIFLTVNGQYMGDFAAGDLKIAVFNGDYLEIDASAFPHPAQFVIHVPNAGLIYPEDGMMVEVKGTTVAIGKVRFK